MKHTATVIIVFAVSAALGTVSFAQGRHDDKPHGMMKSAPAASEKKGAPGAMGRHDERPHGQKKPAAKKPADKPAADKAEAPK
jgi:hypothetical protein